jgi:hypothetical protein
MAEPDEAYGHGGERSYTWMDLVAPAALFAVVGVPLIFVNASMLEVVSITCSTPTEQPVCSPSLRSLARYSVTTGVALGLAACVVGGAVRIRRNRAPKPWVVVAWLLLGLGLLGSCGVGLS